jgi:hypothetical protein
MDDETDYLIWSNEHGAWWATNRQGYTRHLSLAGRYNHADALMICTQAVPGSRQTLNELPVQVRDMMLMLRGPMGEAYEPGTELWE